MSEPKLSDLDRCLHGRHAIDNCLDCPGGWSLGNAYLLNGQRIGTDLYGRPILVGQVKGPIRRGPDQQPLPPEVACDDSEPHEAHLWLDADRVDFGAGRASCPGVADVAVRGG
jgi:hypothetical protein